MRVEHILKTDCTFTPVVCTELGSCGAWWNVKQTYCIAGEPLWREAQYLKSQQWKLPWYWWHLKTYFSEALQYKKSWDIKADTSNTELLSTRSWVGFFGILALTASSQSSEASVTKPVLQWRLRKESAGLLPKVRWLNKCQILDQIQWLLHLYTTVWSPKLGTLASLPHASSPIYPPKDNHYSMLSP